MACKSQQIHNCHCQGKDSLKCLGEETPMDHNEQYSETKNKDYTICTCLENGSLPQVNAHGVNTPVTLIYQHIIQSINC